MTRKKPPIWVFAIGGALAGALLAGGIAYAVQQQRIAAAEEKLRRLEEVAMRTEDERAKAVAKLRELEASQAATGTVEEPEQPSEPEPSDSPATPLPSSQFTFVEKLTYGKPGTIVLDYAEYLTGKKAADAAKAHGDESPPPNDYYIVNDNTKLRTFKIAGDAKVRLVSNPDGTSDPSGYEATVEQWAGYFAAPSDENAAIRAAGYWVVLKGDTVIAVREQFVP